MGSDPTLNPTSRGDSNAPRGLIDALGLPARGSLVSIVGGGGKSALLFALGAALDGRVLLSTTTRIFAAQIERATASCELESPVLETLLAEGTTGLLVIGRVEGEKALGVEPAIPRQWLARDDVDHVIVEADGSRMRPAKVPAEHEPAIATGSTHVVVVAGIDALDQPIERAIHRPERASELLGRPVDQKLTEADLAALISHANGGLKNVPDDSNVLVMINKVESDESHARAQRVASLLQGESQIDRVVVGALEGSDPDRWLVY